MLEGESLSAYIARRHALHNEAEGVALSSTEYAIRASPRVAAAGLSDEHQRNAAARRSAAERVRQRMAPQPPPAAAQRAEARPHTANALDGHEGVLGARPPRSVFCGGAAFVHGQPRLSGHEATRRPASAAPDHAILSDRSYNRMWAPAEGVIRPKTADRHRPTPIY